MMFVIDLQIIQETSLKDPHLKKSQSPCRLVNFQQKYLIVNYFYRPSKTPIKPMRVAAAIYRYGTKKLSIKSN